jgi:galactitol-specific phosphotransferase system IIB component
MSYEDIISLREFARRLNVNEKLIRRGISTGKIKDGVIIENGKPKIKFSVAIVEARNIGLGAKVNGQMSSTPEQPINRVIPKQKVLDEKPDSESEEDYIAGLGPETSLITANRAERIFKAQLACLEVEQKAGTLVNKAEVYSQLFSFGKELTTEFETMPAKVLHKIIGCNNDESKIQELLATEIRQSLNKILEKIPNIKIG